MTRRILLILIAAVILVALGLGIVLLVDRTPALQNALAPAGDTNETTNNANAAPATNDNTNAHSDRAAIEYVARNFSELYGSGTTQNDFVNIIEAKQWGTANFNSYLDRLVALERSKGPHQKFTRTISTALVIKISKQAAATAAVTVTLQRTDSGEAGDKQYYQDIHLDEVKQEANWKINAATWQPTE